MANCHPKINKKKFAIWCEECNLVFEDVTVANEHQEKEKHRIRKIEYLVTEHHYFWLVTSEPYPYVIQSVFYIVRLIASSGFLLLCSNKSNIIWQSSSATVVIKTYLRLLLRFF